LLGAIQVQEAYGRYVDTFYRVFQLIVITHLYMVQVPPRATMSLAAEIPNWSPTVDFVTTDEFSVWNRGVGARGNEMVPWTSSSRVFRKPDRIFAACGRGTNGSITEYRVGYPAEIQFEFEYPIPINRSWIVRASLTDPGEGFHMILSFPDTTTILHLSQHMDDVKELGSEASPYDLSSRTLVAAQVSSDMIIQVTEHYLIILSGTDWYVQRLMGFLLGSREFTNQKYW